MKGFGTVVTGTLISGSISRDDELELFPSGRKLRVRGIQVHGTAADQAVAGQRTALNLAGASTADLARGMSLAPPGTFHAGKRVDVSLTLLPSAKPLKDRARVHLHVYTAEARRSSQENGSSLSFAWQSPDCCFQAIVSSFASFHQ
jgi:selenocysteine-specific elongation factor